jgi:hypothetical protein
MRLGIIHQNQLNLVEHAGIIIGGGNKMDGIERVLGSAKDATPNRINANVFPSII